MPAANRVDESAKDEVYRAQLAQVTRDRMKETVHRQIEQAQTKDRK